MLSSLSSLSDLPTWYYLNTERWVFIYSIHSPLKPSILLSLQNDRRQILKLYLRGSSLFHVGKCS